MWGYVEKSWGQSKPGESVWLGQSGQDHGEETGAGGRSRKYL